jgi:hypothetical protein
MQKSSAIPPNELNIFLSIPLPFTQYPLSAGGGHRYNDSLENVIKVGEKDDPQSNKGGFFRKLFCTLFYEIR